jgi:hypothetical protein
MSKGIPDYFGHDKYNIATCDVCRLILYCEPEEVSIRTALKTFFR